MARSSARISFGAKRCTRGSGRLVRPSENNCAEVSRLRRSWLIFDTASPSAARWLFCCSIEARSRCMPASSRSARPISSWRRGHGDDARRILRIVAEPHHVRGDAAHRPHQQVMQREIDQHRGDAGDDERQQHDVEREAQHGLAQRRLVQHDLEEVAAHRRRPDHPHHVLVVGQTACRRHRGWRGTTTRRACRCRGGSSAACRRRRAAGAACPSSSPPRGRRRCRRICRARLSGTMPLGAASSTSAAVWAAASRSFSQLSRKLAIDGT